MSDWISVKDRMPEDGRTRNVRRSDGILYVAAMTGAEGFFADDGEHLPDVTHWWDEPLPDPPEANE